MRKKICWLLVFSLILIKAPLYSQNCGSCTPACTPGPVPPPNYPPAPYPIPSPPCPAPCPPDCTPCQGPYPYQSYCPAYGGDPCGRCEDFPSAPIRGAHHNLNWITMSIPLVIIAGVAAIILTQHKDSH